MDCWSMSLVAFLANFKGNYIVNCLIRKENINTLVSASFDVLCTLCSILKILHLEFQRRWENKVYVLVNQAIANFRYVIDHFCKWWASLLFFYMHARWQVTSISLTSMNTKLPHARRQGRQLRLKNLVSTSANYSYSRQLFYHT